MNSKITDQLFTPVPGTPRANAAAANKDQSDLERRLLEEEPVVAVAATPPVGLTPPARAVAPPPKKPSLKARLEYCPPTLSSFLEGVEIGPVELRKLEARWLELTGYVLEFDVVNFSESQYNVTLIFGLEVNFQPKDITKFTLTVQNKVFQVTYVGGSFALPDMHLRGISFIRENEKTGT